MLRFEKMQDVAVACFFFVAAQPSDSKSLTT
jgi:hypothetical protein